MSSSRSHFLKGLRARLQSDIALREAERDEESTDTRLERLEKPETNQEPAREQTAGDRIDTGAESRAAQVKPQRDAGSEAAAPVELRQPTNTSAPVSLSYDRGEGLSAHPSASWAEAGMPLRLRDAIASVRRVSHELYQGDPHHDILPAPPFAAHGGDDDFLSDREPEPEMSWNDGLGLGDPPTASEGLVQADRIDSSTNETVFRHAPMDEWPPANNHLRESQRAFQRERIELEEDGAAEEPGLRNQFVPKSDEHAQTLHDGAYHEPGMRGDATHEEKFPDDGDADEEPSSGPGEDRHDPLPARRGTTAGYGVHVTALAGAIVFVALAGFGFAILSDSAERLTSARNTASGAPAPEELSPPPASTKTPPPLDELVTLRVTPPPGDALAEPASVAPTSRVAPVTALPLPPPPKPDVPQAATDQAPRNSQLGDATADAAIVPARAAEPVDQAVSAPSEGEGTGGPFEPLFAKLSPAQASGGQVLVQYMADAAGGPATAMHIVRQLKAAGFSVEARAVPFSIRANSIRYFFPGDRDRAEALRASLEGQLPGDAALAVMDFSSFQPKPQEGHLEIWLRS
jgi:hypothetical protein